MLGRRKDQMSFADADQWWKDIPKDSIWHRIRAWAGEHLHDEDFAAWYSPIGRPSIPPSYVLTLTLLQFRQGWSDQQAVDEARFDDRVKYALGVGRSPEISCDPTTLCRYRSRFLEGDVGRTLLRQTLGEAQAAGLLGDAEDLIDSFMVAGAAARQGTLTLIRQAVRKVLGEVEEASLAAPQLRRTDYGTRKKPDIDWGDAAARSALLQDLVADARLLYAHFQPQQDQLPQSLRQALELLHIVTEQDITTGDDGHVEIAQKVAPDRVISTADPEMRHGRKTSSLKFDGYKAHVSVQNRQVGQGAFVTGVVVTGGNVGDGDATADVMREREANTGALPEGLMGDTSYGGSSVRETLADMDPQLKLTAPVPPASNRAGRFTKDQFNIDLESRTITCPAGQTAAIPEHRSSTSEDSSQSVAFPRATCAACPLRAQCVGEGKGPRHITVAANEAKLQAERVRQMQPDFQKHYRQRSRVEHANRLLTAHGGRVGRYFGKAKTAFQLLLVGVVYNIEELARAKAFAVST